MTIDFGAADRWIMGEAWIGSSIPAHIQTLCDDIGVRWASSDGDLRAARYISGRFEAYGLNNVDLEPFPLKTWRCDSVAITVAGEESWVIDARPTLFCPSVSLSGPLVDAGYGMPHEIDRLGGSPQGAIALMDTGFEPFSPPRLFTTRLTDLAAVGARVVITPSPHGGRRTNHTSANDWRDGEINGGPLPTIQTSREDGARLRNRAARSATATVEVDATYIDTTSRNVVSELAGEKWPEEHLLLGAHFDTTPDSFGGNDNGSGSSVLMETARILSGLAREKGIRPGMSIRFVTFGAEEQVLQGSAAYVARHHGSETAPKLALHLDELATGNVKGVALQFPDLRNFVQTQLDTLNEGFRCHVFAQYDASGDTYSFARAGIHSGGLWRWRFVGRHPDVEFGHSSSDTPDKVRVRELKEYAGFLARLLLRLSDVPPVDWPANNLDVRQIAKQIEAQHGTVVRTM